MAIAESPHSNQPLPPVDGTAPEVQKTPADHAVAASHLATLTVGDANPMHEGDGTWPEGSIVPAPVEQLDDWMTVTDGHHAEAASVDEFDDLGDFLDFDADPDPEVEHAEACYLAFRDSQGHLDGDPEGFLNKYGVTPADVAAWYEGRPDYEKEQMARHQAQEQSKPDREAQIRATLESSEGGKRLLEGRLPIDQENRLGGLNYMLGSRQDSFYTVEDARRQLEEQGGAWSNIAQAYIFFDDHTSAADIDVAVVSGFRGVDAGGKMIVAVPYSGELATRGVEGTIDTAVDVEGSQLPPDYFVSVTDAAGKVSTVVNNKYVAGLVDELGVWHENTGFGRSSVVEFVSPAQ